MFGHYNPNLTFLSRKITAQYFNLIMKVNWTRLGISNSTLIIPLLS